MEAPKPDELLAVQRLVNEKLRADIAVHPVEKGYEEAIAGGALAFFGEKYAERVRVVEVCETAPTDAPPGEAERCFSAELCGGTHCESTGQVGSFLIVGEESIGAGVRRIEALTGRAAEAYVEAQSAAVRELAGRLDTQPEQLVERVTALQEELKAQSKRLQALERDSARRAAEGLLAGAERVDAASVVAGRVPAVSAESLREAGDWLRDRLGSAVVVLGAIVNGRPSFVAMITRDLTARGLHAGELVKKVAAVAGGGGGGRPDVAQAGGKDPGRLDEALKEAHRLAREALTDLPPAPEDGEAKR
jgi:alanyl-tRNA synthetase